MKTWRRQSGSAAPEKSGPFTHPLVLSNVPVDPEDAAFHEDPSLEATQEHGTCDSLTLYIRVHSA